MDKAAKHKEESVTTSGEQAGFSLFELIVALALVSLISVVLFQSVVTQWTNVQRVSAAVDQVRQIALREAVLRDVVGHIVAGWPEQAGTVFRGTDHGFSGLTARSTLPGRHGLFPLEVRVVDGDSGAQRLILRQEESTIGIIDSLDLARLSYRGLDNQWYERWPPEANPGNGFFDDGDYFPTPPLPEAVRIDFTFRGEKMSWIFALSRSKNLPLRAQDLVGQSET